MKRKRTKFLNCIIDFGNQVFQPRVETEFWVGKEIKNFSASGGKIDVLDIFAGTGCIGIAILKACPERCRRVTLVDISKEAMEQIKINLKLNKIEKGRCKIIQSDLFEKLRGEKYDFIFANPPYVALDRINEVQKEVLKQDPYISLFSGKDGLDCIKMFLRDAKKHLRPNGKIFLEFDPLQKEKIKEILKSRGFKFIFKKDQFGKYRWLEAGLK